MDMVESHWDDELHTKKQLASGSHWGWHDIGVKVRGEPAKAVWQNFRVRWHEASTLPDHHYMDSTGKKKFFNPGISPPVPPAAPPGDLTLPSTPLPAVQILRSRYEYKIPSLKGGGVSWAGIPGESPSPEGSFREIFLVLKKAILAASKYIYIEDQFLQDMPYLEQSPQSPGLSLFPHLLTALISRPTLKLVCVGSGSKDPGDPGPDAVNRKLTSSLATLVAAINMPNGNRVAVFRRENKTVHSKLVIIDDDFAAVGSANFQERSMFGVDQELHAAIVSDDTTGDQVKNARIRLWTEHWNLDSSNPAILAALKDIDKALGLWQEGWFQLDPQLWPNLTNNVLGAPEEGIPGFLEMVQS
jgi:hypothetical protein